MYTWDPKKHAYGSNSTIPASIAENYTLVSKFAAHSGLILTTVLVVIFLFRYFLFEKFIMPKYYGTIYKELNERARRGFVNHHVAGILKVVLLFWAVYPFISVTFTRNSFHQPLFHGSALTMGDALVMASHIFVGMYVHELLYRSELSWVAIGHHVGTVIIAEVAVAITVVEKEWHIAGTEFILCLIWGLFDVTFESWVHGVIIVKRCYPNNLVKIRNWNRAACFGTGIGTFLESIAVLMFFGAHFRRWTIAFKIVTPVLHVVFSAAQIWGTKNYYEMWKQTEAEIKKQAEVDGLERGESNIEPSKLDSNVTVVAVDSSSKEYKI